MANPDSTAQSIEKFINNWDCIQVVSSLIFSVNSVGDFLPHPR
jgi:t-SNARE complex subunit (syntaxin)